jgi:hypothetical protein
MAHISRDLAGSAPTKPSKPGSVGFVVAASAESPEIHAEAIAYGKILPSCRIGEVLSAGNPSPHPIPKSRWGARALLSTGSPRYGRPRLSRALELEATARRHQGRLGQPWEGSRHPNPPRTTRRNTARHVANGGHPTGGGNHFRSWDLEPHYFLGLDPVRQLSSQPCLSRWPPEVATHI